MSAEKFVKDTRSAMSAMAGVGAVSLGGESVNTWRALAGRARSLGLGELGGRMDEVSRLLENRGAYAFEPSLPLFDAVLSVHDRVEHLASTLELWAVEAAFAGGLS